MGDTANKDRNTEHIEIKLKISIKFQKGRYHLNLQMIQCNPTFQNAEATGSDKLVQCIYSFYGEGQNISINIFNINDFICFLVIAMQKNWS